jgi:radical SAM-linked protein
LLRALRRARLPLAYSQGFNPKPRVQFGPALAVGIESLSEYLDLESTGRLDVLPVLEAINASLPSGLRGVHLEELLPGTPGLAESLRAARYLVRVPEGVDPARAASTFATRDQVTVTREKNGKEVRFTLDDWLLDVSPIDAGAFRMTLGIGGEGASVRPDEVLLAMFGEAGRSATLVREDLAAVGHAERAAG